MKILAGMFELLSNQVVRYPQGIVAINHGLNLVLTEYRKRFYQSSTLYKTFGKGNYC